jgi:UvrD-like helicase C-terminal domain
MIDAQLGRDVRALGVPTLIFADHFQLPPPGDEEGYFMQRRPNVRLSEIHRQAADNPIIAFGDQVRRGKWYLRPRDSMGEQVRIVRVHGFPADFDVALCGRNATRHQLNDVIRRDRGFSGRRPRVGEIVVCGRNDMKVTDPVYNGSTWEVLGSRVVDDQIVELKLRAQQIADSTTTVRVPLACFGLNPPQLCHGSKLQDFAYGYALTVHKAQGSEWANVLLVDERFCFPGMSLRWLYTGITRARESITIEVPA